MTTIAITGVSGLLGRRLAAALERRDDVERVIGLDRLAPQGLTCRKLAFRQADVRDPAVADAVHGADVVIHLAFQVDPIHDETRMRAVNVDGTRNVFEAARRAGARIVYTSSVTVYGAHPDNDVPLTEDSPMRETPDFSPSEHTREVEDWLASWQREHSDVEVAVLRLAAVLGPGLDNALSRMLEAPRITVIKGHKPPLQFLHLDDAVAAILHAVDRRLTGVYNVCAEGWLSFDEVTAIASKRTMEVPEEVAFSTAERLWRLGIGDAPPGAVRHLMHPWVMSADRLIATGWQPRFTNRDALAQTVREHADHLSLIGLRARRRTLWRVAGGLAAWLGVLVLRSRRRRRRRQNDV